MTATIIPFPDRMAAVAAAAGSGGEVRRRHDAVVAALRTTAVGTGHTGAQWYRTAHRVLDHIDDLVEQELGGPDVIALCEHATSCLLDAAPEIDDPPTVTALLRRLRELHLRACRSTPPDPVGLAAFVDDLARRSDGPVPPIITPYLPLLGRLGIAELRRRLAADEQAQRRRSTSAAPDELVRIRSIRAAVPRARHPSAVS